MVQETNTSGKMGDGPGEEANESGGYELGEVWDRILFGQPFEETKHLRRNEKVNPFT